MRVFPLSCRRRATASYVRKIGTLKLIETLSKSQCLHVLEHMLFSQASFLCTHALTRTSLMEISRDAGLQRSKDLLI